MLPNSEDVCCERCNHQMSIPQDFEPTRWCNDCAQAIAERAIEALKLVKNRVVGEHLPHWNCNNQETTGSRLYIADVVDIALAELTDTGERG